MKKYIFSIIALLTMGFVFTSCDPETNEEPGGTAVENVAGHWVVTTDVIDENGTVLAENIMAAYYEGGLWELFTYNTANDDADCMWISDENNFWGFAMKIPVDTKSSTFECKDVYIYTDKYGEDVFATITDGKVVKNGGVNIHGKPVDSIELKMEFTDDPGTIYYIHGVRYQGFTE